MDVIDDVRQDLMIARMIKCCNRSKTIQVTQKYPNILACRIKLLQIHSKL